MLGRDGLYRVAVRRLILAGLAVGALWAAWATWDAGADMVRLRERAYPIPATDCEKTKDCDERSLQIEAREAVTADAAFDVALGQLALSILGIAGVTFTIYYAHKALITSESTLRASLESEQRELRAYVHSVEFTRQAHVSREIGGVNVPGLVIAVAWKNLGATPARRVRTACGARLFIGPTPDDFDYPDIGGDQKGIPLGPGAHTYSTVFTRIDELRTGQLAGNRYYVWFWIEYSDVFADTPRRRTEACVRVRFEGDPGSPDAKVFWEAVTAFSNVDDECRHQPKT
jgi:hypothetical protein